MLRETCCAMVLFLALAPAVHADLIVNVGSITLSAGSLGYVPVHITDTHTGTALDPGDAVGNVSYVFQITEGATHLQFTDSPAPPSIYSSDADPNYIFHGQSFDDSPPTPIGVGTASSSSLANTDDTFSGGDSATNSDVTVTSADNFLLAYLPVTAMTSLAPMVGDVFTISLVPRADDSPQGPPTDSTYFSNGAETTFYPFTSTPGTVTITPATAVPEPGTFGMLLIGMSGLALAKRRRRK